MYRALTAIAIVVGAMGGSGSAIAAPQTITGTVMSAPSRWTADHSRIVTDATIATASGEVVVSQLGGTVDGLTMRTFPAQAPLVPGMQVTVTAHADRDLAQRMHVVVDDVQPLAGAAYDFVRTGPTKAGHYIYWESGCVFMTEDSAGTIALAGDTEFPLMDQAIATWNADTASCSYMIMKSLGSAAGEVGNDGVNLIKFRDTTWGRPAVDDDPARAYSPSAAGLTTAVYFDDGSSRDGAIVDADVELNGVDFAISNGGVSLSMQACQAELLNTLTHELGHVHGLEHTCLADGDPPRVDNLGNPVPSCDTTTDPTILDATMYNFQDCGETKKETLSPDDINGICTIYPTASDPGTCAPVDEKSGGCCDAGSRGAPGAVLLSALAGLALARRRRG